MVAGHTYCVAPILSADAEKAEFWAVGVDCCGARASFMCDDAAVATVSDQKTGLVHSGHDGYHFIYQFLRVDSFLILDFDYRRCYWIMVERWDF